MGSRFTMRKVRGNFVLQSICLIVLFASFVSAYAISTPYFEGHPLKMKSGASANVTLHLQNVIGDDDEKVRIEVIDGYDKIAKIVDDSNEYYLPAHKEGIPVNVEVSLPENYTKGMKFEIPLKISPVPIKGAEEITGIGIAISMRSRIVVEVIGEEEKPTEIKPIEEIKPEEVPEREFKPYNYYYVIGAFVILAALIVLWLTLKKRGKRFLGRHTRRTKRK